jgi:hypothetical protein
MRIHLYCAGFLFFGAVAAAQTIAPAAGDDDLSRRTTGSLERFQQVLSRVAKVEKELGKVGESPAPDSIRLLIHELGVSISDLSSECAKVQSAVAPGRQTLESASASLKLSARKHQEEAASETDFLIKRQNRTLSRQEQSDAENMERTTQEWEKALKKLDGYSRFLTKSGAIILAIEKKSEQISIWEPTEHNWIVDEAIATARTVGSRAGELRKLNEGLSDLKAAVKTLHPSGAVGESAPSSAATPREPATTNRSAGAIVQENLPKVPASGTNAKPNSDMIPENNWVLLNTPRAPAPDPPPDVAVRRASSDNPYGLGRNLDGRQRGSDEPPGIGLAPPATGAVQRMSPLADRLVEQVDDFIRAFQPTVGVVPEGPSFLADARALMLAARKLRRSAGSGAKLVELSQGCGAVVAHWERLRNRTDRVAAGRTGPNIQRVHSMGATVAQMQQALEAL